MEAGRAPDVPLCCAARAPTKSPSSDRIMLYEYSAASLMSLIPVEPPEDSAAEMSRPGRSSLLAELKPVQPTIVGTRSRCDVSASLVVAAGRSGCLTMRGTLFCSRVGGGALARHAVRPAQLAVIGGADHHRVIQEALVVQLTEHRSELPVAVPDAVEVVVLKALPTVILVGYPHPRGADGPLGSSR